MKHRFDEISPRPIKGFLFILMLFGFASVSHADSVTPRLGLIIPTIGSPTWGQKMNSNFQILDSTVNAQSGNVPLGGTSVGFLRGDSTWSNGPMSVSTGVAGVSIQWDMIARHYVFSNPDFRTIARFSGEVSGISGGVGSPYGDAQIWASFQGTTLVPAALFRVQTSSGANAVDQLFIGRGTSGVGTTNAELGFRYGASTATLCFGNIYGTDRIYSTVALQAPTYYGDGSNLTGIATGPNIIASGVIGSNVGQYNINGTTVTFTTPPTDLVDRLFVLNNGQVTYPAAVTDGARKGQYNLFTTSNSFSSPLGVYLDKLIGYTVNGSSVDFNPGGSGGIAIWSGGVLVAQFYNTSPTLGAIVGLNTSMAMGGYQARGLTSTLAGKLALFESVSNSGSQYVMFKAPPDVLKTSEFEIDADTDTAGFWYSAVGGALTQSSDPEVYSATKTYSVCIATNGVTWDSLTVSLGAISATRSATIRSVWVYVSSGTSLAFNIDKRTAGSEGSVGTNITSGSITATTTGAATTVFSSASLAANDQLFFKTATSAATGTVFSVTIEIRYTD